MASERPILIVDDDRKFREALAEQLRFGGNFAVEQASTVAQAARLLNGSPSRYDAIILDVALPDGDGRDFCADQRRQGRRTPIIILTGSFEEADVVRGLDAGASDYVIKPVRIAELLARLRAQMRILESSEDAVFKIGPYTFHPSTKLLQEIDGGRQIRLTVKEVGILKFLYRSGSTPASREALLNAVWGYDAAVHTKTLETHIYRLRQKIEPNPAARRLLINEKACFRLDL